MFVSQLVTPLSIYPQTDVRLEIHSVTSQETNIDIITTAITSDINT